MVKIVPFNYMVPVLRIILYGMNLREKLKEGWWIVVPRWP